MAREGTVGTHINVGKASVALGIVLGGWHLLWSLLVAGGWAQTIVDFVLWMHFIKPIYVIEPFEFMRAVILVLVTGAAGLAVGATFAVAWNALHKV
jgi:hypothetical protein